MLAPMLKSTSGRLAASTATVLPSPEPAVGEGLGVAADLVPDLPGREDGVAQVDGRLVEVALQRRDEQVRHERLLVELGGMLWCHGPSPRVPDGPSD